MSITLQAFKRAEKGRKNYSLRASGRVPAVLYGAGVDPVSVAVDAKAFAFALKEAGESTLVDLVLPAAKPLKVLIQDFQIDPIYHRVIHADFRSVDMTRPIEARIKLRFVGEAPAVKGLGGTMVHAKDEIRVKGLPQDLVPTIDVDVSSLATFDDVIHLKDLILPSGLTMEDDPNVTVALVAQPRSEEELAALDTAIEMDVSGVEVSGKKKEEADAAPVDEAGVPPAAKSEEKK
jgi:large subunit ribosomal protein L25